MFNKVTNEQMLEDCFKIRKEVFVKRTACCRRS